MKKNEDGSTWIGPFELDVGLIVVGKGVGASKVEIEGGRSLLQRCIDGLKHVRRVCEEATRCCGDGELTVNTFEAH